MNCVNHSDTQAVAYCRTCGKALCNACTRDVRGVIYCEPCLAERLHHAPPLAGAAPRPGIRPKLAAFLGFIPGVGAMYNGQFLKGLLHAGVFIFLIWLTDHVSDFFGLLIAFYFFYMVFDAYKTAEAMERGFPVPDPFGLEKVFGPSIVHPTGHWAAPAPTSAAENNPPPPTAAAAVYAGAPAPPAPEAQNCEKCGGIPIGAIILIGLGVLFLLDNLGWLNISVERYWPLLIIVIGVWMLFRRWNQSRVS